MPFPLSPRLPRPARFPDPRFLALFFLLAAALLAHAEIVKDIHPTSYVTDLAHVINADTKASLENLCLEVEQKTGAQMAIVTVRSLEGETVEQYGNDLYTQLGIGSKKENRGVLLLVAPTERDYRIEIGYGLEPVITDARSGDAGRLMRSFFVQGDYNRGIEAAAWQLAKYIAADRGVTLSATSPAQRASRGGNSRSIPIWPILIFIFVVIQIFRGLGGRGGRPGSGWWIGPVIGGMLGGGGFGGSSGGRSEGGGGFGGFGGGSSGGGGASGSW